MVVFDSLDVYVTSAKSNLERIQKIDNIINLLLDVAVKMAAQQVYSEYTLDDGQSKISTVYRDTASVERAILAFESLKMMYINRTNGRMVRLVDSRNFVRGYNRFNDCR